MWSPLEANRSDAYIEVPAVVPRREVVVSVESKTGPEGHVKRGDVCSVNMGLWICLVLSR
jgi:hypothetical protein